ncbi:MAG: PLDc N-terminal domain-containing protein [Deltaproteobacteria bacterium]|nr:PLDc N-terminal domain-containing protein [Deltaproteobacteria bacterium]
MVLQNLSLILPSVPMWIKVPVLLIPLLPNLWCIWQAARKTFPYSTEKMLWLGLGMFFPVIGGLIFLAVGQRRVVREINTSKQE